MYEGYRCGPSRLPIGANRGECDMDFDSQDVTLGEFPRRRTRMAVLALSAATVLVVALVLPQDRWAPLVASLFLAFLAGLSSLWSP